MSIEYFDSFDSDDLAINVWIDKSGSIINGNVPQVVWSDISPLVDLIDQVNGTLAVGVIGETTRSEMAFYSHKTNEVKLPERKDNMSAAEYRKELLAYKKRKSRKRYQPDQQKLRSEFKMAVMNMLDYSRLEYSSLICEAVNVSTKMFHQENNKDGRKFLLMITDFLHNGNEACPLRLDNDISLLVVNRLSATTDILFAQSEHYVNIEAAVEFILNNS